MISPVENVTRSTIVSCVTDGSTPDASQVVVEWEKIKTEITRFNVRRFTIEELVAMKHSGELVLDSGGKRWYRGLYYMTNL